jgi:hypothetical protein
LKSEKVAVQFYLMEAMARTSPQERRQSRWLPFDQAIDALAHQESRDLLRIPPARAA